MERHVRRSERIQITPREWKRICRRSALLVYPTAALVVALGVVGVGWQGTLAIVCLAIGGVTISGLMFTYGKFTPVRYLNVLAISLAVLTGASFGVVFLVLL